MRFSVAAATLLAMNPPAAAGSSVKDDSSPTSPSIGIERLAMDVNNGGNSNPKIRSYREHWTMPHEFVEHGHPSNSALLTNQKATTEAEGPSIDTTQLKDNTPDSHGNKDGADLGILSSSRKLNPYSARQNALLSRPNSDVFDSFMVFDRDRTEFYSICDPTVEDEYFCSRCDTNKTEKTVADFECQRISCYEIDSRCPNNRMVVCRYDTLSRLFDYEPPTSTASVPYTSEKCRRIETRLSKMDRELLPTEESSWDFTYCLRYNIASLASNGNNTCQMEVDGKMCNSCSLETVQSSQQEQEFCVNFDCGNTLLGYNGRFCNAADLATKSLDYFVYRSLPCDGGCNLCGDRTEDAPTKMNMMTFRDAIFTVPDINVTDQTAYLNVVGLPSTMNCFGAQWEALTGTASLVCPELTPAVQESCGCIPVGVDPPPVNETANSTASGDDGGDGEEDSGAIQTDAGAIQTSVSTLLASLAAACLIGFFV